MAYSRLGRYEEKRQQKRLALAIGGIIAVLAFVALFGIKLLVGFSLFVDRLRGNSPQPTPSQSLILPPVLDPLPEATNSATIIVSGRGQPGLKVIIYVNETEFKRIPVGGDGNFSLDSVKVTDGKNTVSAKLIDDKKNLSDLSNVITTVVNKTPPLLDISNPSDGAQISGESNFISIEGKTQENASVTVNDRRVVVSSDGFFKYAYPLPEGDTTLKFVATDQAGNQKTVERKVSYHK